jgi:glucokinase
LGAGASVDDLVVVTLGTGIGAGLVVGGRLQRGANGLAGEVGHLTVQVDGRSCGCGRRGCWERYASGSALADHARVLSGRSVTGEQVMAAAREQQSWALEVVDVFATWVAMGLANLANVTDPARFVIGGGLASEGDVLLAPLVAAYRQSLYASSHRPVADIVMATLGPRAGAIGAALLAGLPR